MTAGPPFGAPAPALRALIGVAAKPLGCRFPPVRVARGRIDGVQYDPSGLVMAVKEETTEREQEGWPVVEGRGHREEM